MNTIVIIDQNDLKEVVSKEFKSAVRELLEEVRFNSPPVPEKFGIEGAEKILGRGRSWIYKATCKNIIPFQKFGSRIIFDRNDLETWMAQHTHNPKIEIRNQLYKKLQRSAVKKEEKL